MLSPLTKFIALRLSDDLVVDERKMALRPLIDYMQQQLDSQLPIRLNFICTHNSRRSHLAQVWAQVAAAYYAIPAVYSYSGGTEATALFPKVAETLAKQGLSLFRLSDGENPIYAFKYAENAVPIMGFSKRYDHPFNPASDFAAIMMCTQADEGCPFIAGASKRISLPYDDPKSADGSSLQDDVYLQRSEEIAAAFFYAFSQLKNNVCNRA